MASVPVVVVRQSSCGAPPRKGVAEDHLRIFSRCETNLKEKTLATATANKQITGLVADIERLSAKAAGLKANIAQAPLQPAGQAVKMHFSLRKCLLEYYCIYFWTRAGVLISRFFSS